MIAVTMHGENVKPSYQEIVTNAYVGTPVQVLQMTEKNHVNQSRPLRDKL